MRAVNKSWCVLVASLLWVAIPGPRLDSVTAGFGRAKHTQKQPE